MESHMQYIKSLSLLQNCGLSYAISRISFYSPKTWTIICNFWNFFPFSKNVEYHMQFITFLSLLEKYGLSYAILEFLSDLQKRGLSYAISGISFPSAKTWTPICNL